MIDSELFKELEPEDEIDDGYYDELDFSPFMGGFDNDMTSDYDEGWS